MRETMGRNEKGRKQGSVFWDGRKKGLGNYWAAT